MIAVALDDLLAARSLDRTRARAVMGLVMDGEATPVQIAGLLVALRAKGETAEEIAGFAEAMRERMVPVTIGRHTIDVVGTGGDGRHTFNISTAAALVAAAAGAAVAKHGNRAASSPAGAADVLEALGLVIEQTPERIAASVETLGFGFMFARAHHPAMRHAAPVRRELGTRTVFNVLGPLCNPAGTCDGVFGVYDAALARIYAEALAALGSRRAFVVHADDGTDEISPSCPTLVVEVVSGSIEEWELDPRALGIYPSPPEDLRGGTPEENAAAMRALFAGERGGRRDAVVLNAGAALAAAGIVADIGEGLGLAESTIDSGAVTERLRQVVESSRG
ncbi:MAG: anthranilate phosphoribosyltransferase [Gaiella sp.]